MKASGSPNFGPITRSISLPPPKAPPKGPPGDKSGFLPLFCISRFICPKCLYKVAHVFRSVAIRQSLIVRPGDEVRSVRDALDGGYRLGGEVREFEWEDAFYYPICGFRSVDLDAFRAEQEEVEAGSGEEGPEKAVVIAGGWEEVEVEEPDAPEEQEPKTITMSHKGWVTLDDFLTGQGGGEGAGAGQEPERADGAEAPSAEEEKATEQEQAGNDQSCLTSDESREEQVMNKQGSGDQPYVTSGDQQAVVDLLFKKKRESKEFQEIKAVFDYWAKKYWFTVLDMEERSDDYAKAIATVKTDRMVLFLFMLEELDEELRRMGFCLALVRPVGENLAEIQVWNIPRRKGERA